MSNYIVLSEYQDGNPVHLKKSAISVISRKSEKASVTDEIKDFLGLPFKSTDYTYVSIDGAYTCVLETPAEIARKLR